MALTLTPGEERRLERAIDLAALSEGERVLWMTGFLALAVVGLMIVASTTTWVGAVGSVSGWFFLYARLRAPWLAGQVRGDHGLFGLSLGSKEQRAFTGLMLRQALTGRNPLRARPQHDPRRPQVVAR